MSQTRDYLIDQYRQKHQATPNYGPGPKESEVRDIVTLCEDHLANLPDLTPRALDYGAGNSRLIEQVCAGDHWERVRYDPAIPEIAGEPDGEFGFALCTDVLEHIPEIDVPAFLYDIATLARYAFFTVCTSRAVHKLPDGQNAHATVKDAPWWRDQVAGAFVILHQQPARRSHAHFFVVKSRQFD